MLLAQKTSHFFWTLGKNPNDPQNPYPNGLSHTEPWDLKPEIEQSLLDPGTRKMEDYPTKPVYKPNQPNSHQHLQLDRDQFYYPHPTLQVCPLKPHNWPWLEHPSTISYWQSSSLSLWLSITTTWPWHWPWPQHRKLKSQDNFLVILSFFSASTELKQFILNWGKFIKDQWT